MLYFTDNIQYTGMVEGINRGSQWGSGFYG